MIKKVIVTSALVLGALVSVVSAGDEKVRLCHNTGSEKNPVADIEVAGNAVQAHLDHGDTLFSDLPEGTVDCEGNTGPSPE